MAKEKPSEEMGNKESDTATAVIPKQPGAGMGSGIVLESLDVEGSVRDHFFRPAIICGRCENCGTAKYVGGTVKAVVDKKDGTTGHVLQGGHWEEIDATNCVHYKPIYDNGQAVQCSYCKERFTGVRNSLGRFMEILASRIVYVFSFSNEPNKLIMYCDSFECREKHIKRMKNL